MTRARLKGMLIRHEGLKLKPYRCTAGKLTIGVGRNLDDVGLSTEESMHLLENDIVLREGWARTFSWFDALDEVRQDVIIDMLFMGLDNFKEFKAMIAALEKHDYPVAAYEMLDSKWAKQVGDRADELSAMMLSGKY